MEIGRGPLNLVRNVLLCGLCRQRLHGSAAGADIDAIYHGPVLFSITITRGRKVLHQCDLSKPPKTDDEHE